MKNESILHELTHFHRNIISIISKRESAALWINKQVFAGTVFYVSFCSHLGSVVLWSANSGKALQAGDHHIILAERTVDDEQVSTFISATYDPHMLITGIEYQIAGLGLIPRDGGTVGVLHVSAAAMAYDVLSIGDIVKYPIDKSTAI